MSRSNEAFWWSLFTAGGVLGALFLPALILTAGFLLPTADPTLAAERSEHLSGLLGDWLAKIVLIVVLGLSCFMCAHRIRHMLMDVGLRGKAHALAIVCYGAAGAGALAFAFLVGRI